MSDLPRTFAVKELMRRQPSRTVGMRLFLEAPVIVVPGGFPSEGARDQIRLPFRTVIYETIDDTINAVSKGKFPETQGRWFIHAIDYDRCNAETDLPPDPGGPDRRGLLTFMAYTERNGQPLRLLGVGIDYDPKKNEYVIFPMDERFEVSKPMTDLGHLLYALAIRCVLLANQAGGAMKAIPASQRNAQARRAIPRSGWEYRILDLSKVPTQRSPSLGGTHASPRWHIRRGHWRQIGDRKVWVRDTEVGSKERGGVVHDYEVPGGED